ncbi:hypothetical protein J4U00_gp114 [Mycobacterium phage DyoEdafos]|uniref:Uncharacterized protein n=1 Tax=Mycobacterium phage DyoEdafos TaxID=2599860 RepID=A0A5J6TI24_9CAUD|nr:hypothetical protein J4U00_gp114 [Mycobacterium phage DyoEdafos]QFG10365.1 hypothetical protein SEA_DYOEDAFOS_155 [Mycobacterium phage DyoEdafos]
MSTTPQINVTTQRSLTRRGLNRLALLVTLGAALAALSLTLSGHAKADTGSGPVMRCTVTNVDGHVYLNDCDLYTDADGWN